MASILNERYEIIERQPVSDGDFAGVSYKARLLPKAADDAEARLVVLKQLPHEADTATVRSAAERAAAVPVSANILRFYGLSEISGEPEIESGLYSVTEYARGISLRERIRRVAPFSLAVSVDITIAICHAIIRADSVGITHNALNPEFILLTPEGQVKVGQFQIAAAIASVLGQDNFCHDDCRSIGLLLYEMLTGIAPDQIIVADEHSPRQLNTSVPPALDGIVRKATSLDSDKQYTDVSRVLADLQSAREDLRAGKSLSWSPMGASPTPHVRSAPKTPGALTSAAKELADEKQKMNRRRKDSEIDQEENADYPVWGKVLLTLLGVIVLGVVFAGAYVFTIFSVPSDIVVPNLIGKQFNDAKNIADSGHFNLVETEHDYSDVLPPGSIYHETPAPGRSIKSGKEVDVWVSDGPRLISVPDLSDMTLSRAIEALSQAGLPQGSVSTDYNETVAKGIVISQQPVANSNIPHDTPVNIDVSKGPPPPQAPGGLSATSSLDGEIDLTWNDDADAVSYNVYRDGVKLTSGLPQAAYSDVNLGSGETHTYTVTGVNDNGESTKSAPASATTLVEGAPADTDTTPPPTNQQTAPDQTPVPASSVGAKQRRFEIRFKVPSTGTHNCQIEVQDTTGTNVVYDQDRNGGDVVDESVIGFGNKIIFRIFVDGKLIRQDTK
jgi:serine/threonine-protein kinase